ncbi:ABC transporter permease [Xanthocytophaga flava]|uniref:ABC transporter permease n=1 Tax=Xanthocytophaga flava TaxID=3048013 RepID=UPI0028D6EF0E|nr:ABC transporter permease [Xanthocytophaga flavus]MDJ1471343.1 ABC transporter permease [Xanthocytophaga flavus]
MLHNYFKITFRNLIRNKGYTFINIGGLAIGMAVAILIGLWVYDELTFNTCHKNYNRIVQVMRLQTRNGEKETSTSNPVPIGDILSTYKADFDYVVKARKPEEHAISYSDKYFTRTGIYIEPEGAEMLSLEMTYGSWNGLKELHSILISESLARTIFGNIEPIGKQIRIDNKVDVTVSGIYRDLPANSDFNEVMFIAPFDLYIFSTNTDPINWTNYNTRIYAKLADPKDLDNVSAKIRNKLLQYVTPEIAARKPEIFLHPMSDWHLYSTFENGVQVTSVQLKFIWFYTSIGLFVLILACINFMNLFTARSEQRAKEVGIRKTMGSVRSQLVKQFYIESLCVTGIAFLLSILIVQLLLPWANQVSGKSMVILWINPFFWLVAVGFILITGLLAGSYPALYLSSFRPVAVLKGTFHTGRFTSLPRKILVVVQFTISVTLIIGTLIVYQQIQFVKNRSVGYNQNGLLMFRIPSVSVKEKYEVLRRELKNTGVITEVARSGNSLTGQSDQNNGFEWEGKDPTLEDPLFNLLPITYEYGKTIGWHVLEGRNFSIDYSTDSSGIIINEAAAKRIGLINPVGRVVTGELDFRGRKDFRILGVVQDIVMQSPFEHVPPAIFFLGGGNYILVRINSTTSVHNALSEIEAIFNKVIPGSPFDYHFVNEDYAHKFVAEEQIGTLVGFFAGLAIFISCLGLFGLASFITKQRTKEIGIRKILGATVIQLCQLLVKESISLVIVASFIAVPITYYCMSNWLQNYTFRTELSWWIFGIVSTGALLIAVLTVGFQSIKAAMTDPVKSLRNE